MIKQLLVVYRVSLREMVEQLQQFPTKNYSQSSTILSPRLFIRYLRYLRKFRQTRQAEIQNFAESESRFVSSCEFPLFCYNDIRVRETGIKISRAINFFFFPSADPSQLSREKESRASTFSPRRTKYIEGQNYVELYASWQK